MSVDIDNPKSYSLREKCALLEARLNDERTAHSLTKTLLRKDRGVTGDETRKRQRERAARQDMLSAFMDSATDSFMILDRDLNFIDVNEAAARRLGRPRSEIIGRALRDIVPQSERSGRTKLYREVVRTGKPRRVAFERTLPSTARESHVAGTAFRIGEDRLGLTLRDVTDRVLAKRALEESERRLAASQRMAHVGTYERDLITDTATWTDELFRVLGLEPGSVEPSVDTLRAAIHPDDLAGLLAEAERLAAGASPVVAFPRVIWPDGSVHTVESRAEVICDSNGAPVRVTWVVQDITDRVAADRALRDSERKYRELVETSHDLIWSCDTAGRFTFVNREGALAILGYEPEEMIGRSLAFFKTKDQAAKDLEVFANILEGNGVVAHETEYRKKDGTFVPMNFNAVVMRDDAGNIVGTTGTARDVSERRRSERALRTSEERFRDFAESASDGYWETDAELRYTNVWGAILGSSRVAGVSPFGKTRWEYIGADPDSDENWRRHKEDLEARRPFRNFEYTYANSKGRHHRRVSGKPVFGAGGTFVGYRGIVENTTEEVEARNEAQRVQERLNGAVGSLPFGIALYDAEDRLVTHNVRGDFAGAAAAFKSGVRFENIIRAIAATGLVLNAVGREEDYVQERLARRRNPGQPFEQSRGERVFEITEHGLPDGGTIVIEADVTEKRGAEQILRQSERRLLESQRIARIGTFERDLESDEMVWTDEAFRLLGYQPGEVRPSIDAYLERIHPDDVETVKQTLTAVKRGEQPALSVRRAVWPDGSIHVLENAATVERDAGGKPVRVIRTMQDITDRVQAEEALRSSRSMFERAFDSNPSLASIVNIGDSRLLKVNDAWCRGLGYTREEVIGKTTDELGIWLDKEAKNRARDEVVKNGTVQEVSTRLRSARGDIIYVEAFADVLEYDGGKAIFTVAHDRGERRRYENALREAKENAEVANRTKSEFLANVSHELRTPLNAILGFSEMMEMGLAGPLTEKQSEYLADVRGSGEHLLGLINDVIDLSTIELGRMELALERISLHKCVADCVTQMRYKIAESGLRLCVGDLTNLPCVTGDARRIKQVLLNLLSNAAKFTDPDGEITIAGALSDARECEITIADTGVGMTQATIRQVMTAFKRGDDPMLRNMEGAGLGLSLVQSMVEAHGGSLALDSVVGVGTRVTVSFPIDGPAMNGGTEEAG